MENALFYIIIGLAIVYIIYRIMDAQQPVTEQRDPQSRRQPARTPERPRIDDPGISSGGSFGRDGSNRSPLPPAWHTDDDDEDTWVRRDPNPRREPLSSDNVESKGSFGADKG